MFENNEKSNLSDRNAAYEKLESNSSQFPEKFLNTKSVLTSNYQNKSKTVFENRNKTRIFYENLTNIPTRDIDFEIKEKELTEEINKIINSNNDKVYESFRKLDSFSPIRKDIGNSNNYNLSYKFKKINENPKINKIEIGENENNFYKQNRFRRNLSNKFEFKQFNQELQKIQNKLQKIQDAQN